MKIKYNGPKNVRRVVGKLVWDKNNQHIVDVKDPQVVKMLLAQPGGEFTKAEGDAPSKKTNS
jgi:hypothetical protein